MYGDAVFKAAGRFSLNKRHEIFDTFFGNVVARGGDKLVGNYLYFVCNVAYGNAAYRGLISSVTAGEYHYVSAYTVKCRPNGRSADCNRLVNIGT